MRYFFFKCIIDSGDFMLRTSLIITLICVLIDQIVKIIIMSFMGINSSVILIPNFFSLTYVENDGAAWSIFSGNRLFLIAISIVALILVYWYFLKNRDMKNFEMINYSILIGGIMGNLLDRIKFGRVIDYLDFKIFGYNFPVFNFADICIVISVILLLIYNLKDRNEQKNAEDNC